MSSVPDTVIIRISTLRQEKNVRGGRYYFLIRPQASQGGAPVPASAVTERTITTRGGHRSGSRSAGPVDAFALDPSRCVSLMWPEESDSEQILCTHSQPAEECAGARKTGQRLPLDALLGRVVEDLLPGPAMASWPADAAPGSQEGPAIAG